MDDTSHCPICGDKLKNINININSVAYINRLCVNGLNHFIQFYLNKKTKHIDYVNLSLNKKYSYFLKINYLLKKSTISCYKDNVPYYIDVPKILNLDFPALITLKQTVNLYIILS